ncbi:MAG: cysteine desulfurase [Oligoflexia bacterium]|nr:cysteine desulfurase [Oligoflexia bacterium]
MEAARLYFDANATLAPTGEMYEQVAQATQGAGNPSSVHQAGQKGRALIERARSSILSLLGLPKASLVFTSGASESNNLALWQPVLTYLSASSSHSIAPQVVISAIEHPSVLECARFLAARGLIRLSECPCTPQGQLDLLAFAGLVGPETKLVSIMYANNETGAIQPIPEAIAVVRRQAANCLIHCDAVQALGKLSLDYSSLDLDMLSFSGHKIGSFAGVGCLVCPKALHVQALQNGGAQEHGQRAGTEPVSAIVSFGIAAQSCRWPVADKVAGLRDWISRELRAAFPLISTTIDLTSALPNTLSLRVPGISADDLVVALDLRGVCVSSGAACSSGKPSPSHVLLAMGLGEEEARSTLRISLAPNISRDEALQFVDEFSLALRGMLQGRSNVAA